MFKAAPYVYELFKLYGMTERQAEIAMKLNYNMIYEFSMNSPKHAQLNLVSMYINALENLAKTS